MIALEVENLLPKFKVIFELYNLDKVYLFGSSLNEDFFRYDSDIDLYFDNFNVTIYKDLKKEFEKITKRKISISTIETIKNHKDKQKIIDSLFLIYEP